MIYSKSRGKASNIAVAILASGVLVGLLDLATNTAITGMALSAMMMPHVNDPPKNVAEKKTPTAPSAVFFQIQWTYGDPHDIDMWTRCYSIVDEKKQKAITVGYFQRSAGWLDLQRDDLGRPSIINLEEVKSNSEILEVPPNTSCRINVHLYHSHGGMLPIEGNLIAISNKDDTSKESLIAVVQFRLNKPGDEITLLYVSWDEEGQVIDDSVQTFPDVKTIPIVTGNQNVPDWENM